MFNEIHHRVPNTELHFKADRNPHPTPVFYFIFCYFWLPWAVEAQFSKPILSHIAADQQVNKNNPAWALKIEWER